MASSRTASATVGTDQHHILPEQSSLGTGSVAGNITTDAMQPIQPAYSELAMPGSRPQLRQEFVPHNPLSQSTTVGPSITSQYIPVPSHSVSTSDADILLGLHSSYGTGGTNPSESALAAHLPLGAEQSTLHPHPLGSEQQPYHFSTAQEQLQFAPQVFPTVPLQQHMSGIPTMYGPGMDMMIESQEIDMSAFGGEMVPWLEFLPQDVLGYIGGDDGGDGGGMVQNAVTRFSGANTDAGGFAPHSEAHESQ